eukprot:CAMPEP_0113691380 /NCGR_PEP_ID=MMETSP0038_2-20120614/18395_1 /TAXON_ID=2898 /ORGANISM="Cryptomonas paramecium" /LENGTH=197 /DNA_ID=CAMNT_0000612971 /DNA_START=216 /DNA_END=806 /DNA_ORIENTATION=+ /assembly_acc=CAM_ASM_000170
MTSVCDDNASDSSSCHGEEGDVHSLHEQDEYCSTQMGELDEKDSESCYHHVESHSADEDGGEHNIADEGGEDGDFETGTSELKAGSSKCSGSASNKDEDKSSSQSAVQKRKKKARMSVNLDFCDYPVITQVCEELGWQITSSASQWGIKWIDRYLLGSTIRDMGLKRGQRINHFPAICELAFKCRLAQNLNRMHKIL